MTYISSIYIIRKTLLEVTKKIISVSSIDHDCHIHLVCNNMRSYMCLKEDKVITQEINIYRRSKRFTYPISKMTLRDKIVTEWKKSNIDRVRLSSCVLCVHVRLSPWDTIKKKRERVNINYSMRISDWTKQLKLLFQRTSLLFPRIHSSSMLDIISLFLSYWAFLVDFYSLRYRGTMCVYAVYIWEGSRDL